MSQGDARSRAARYNREMHPLRKETRRVLRRQQEAEQWAQARIQNPDGDPMPTNRAATDYLTLHYPWLLDQNSAHNSRGSLDTPSDTVKTPLARKTDESAARAVGAIDSPHSPEFLTPASSRVDLPKKVAPVPTTRPLPIELPKRTPEANTIRPSRLSYAAALVSEVPETPTPAEPRKISLRRSDKASHEVQKSKSLGLDDLIGKKTDESIPYVGTSTVGADLEAKISADSLTLEHLRALTAAIDNKIGHLLTESSLRQDERILDILKETTSWVNQRERLRLDQEQLCAQEVHPNRDSERLGTLDDAHGLLPLEYNTQHGRSTSGQCIMPTMETFGGPEPETMLFATGQTQHTVLLPAQQRYQLPPDSPRRPKISRQDSCSPSKQFLRPTAPVFIPQSPQISSSTNTRKKLLQSPAMVLSLTAMSGTQSYDLSTRPTTASSAVKSFKLAPIPCPVPAPQPSVSAKHPVRTRERKDHFSSPIKQATGYRLVSVPNTPSKVDSVAANAKSTSNMNDDFVHVARSTLAIEVACRDIGMSAEDLRSFLAIRVPAIDNIIKLPQVMQEIRTQSKFDEKHDLFRFVVSKSKPARGSVRTHDTLGDSAKNKDALSWRAEDFEGFRVLPSSLGSLEADNVFSGLAEFARISKDATKTTARNEMESYPAQRDTGEYLGARQMVLTDPNKASDYISLDDNAEPLIKASGSPENDQIIDTGSRIVKHYKEEAYFSDVNDVFPADDNQRVEENPDALQATSQQPPEQGRKHSPSKIQRQSEAGPCTPLQRLNRRPGSLLDAYRAHISRQYQATRDQQELQKENIMPRTTIPETPMQLKHTHPYAWSNRYRRDHYLPLPYNTPQGHWHYGSPTEPRFQNPYPYQQHPFPIYWSYPRHLRPAFYE